MAIAIRRGVAGRGGGATGAAARRDRVPGARNEYLK